MSIIRIENWIEAIKNPTYNLTSVNQAELHALGDYGLAVFFIEPGTNQRPHYHTYGDIDIFMVVSGQGKLNLAKVENNQVLKGTEENYDIKAGDSYTIEPFTLHSIDNTGDDNIVVLNVAPRAHSAPMNEESNYIVDILFPEDNT